MIDPSFTENPSPIHDAVFTEPWAPGLGGSLVVGCGDGPDGCLLSGETTHVKPHCFANPTHTHPDIIQVALELP